MFAQRGVGGTAFVPRPNARGRPTSPQPLMTSHVDGGEEVAKKAACLYPSSRAARLAPRFALAAARAALFFLPLPPSDHVPLAPIQPFLQ